MDIIPAFEPYPCSLGTVIGHEGSTYIVSTTDGRTIGISANGTPSPENVEADIASPPAVIPPPLRQASDLVVFRLTDAEVNALTSATAPAAVKRAWLAATSTGIISQADPRFPDLVAALDQLGVIAAARWPALLAP